ncbi:hypothetical protein ACIQ34_00700 [Ureibacillus sp. NPDC094379]
MSIFYETNEPPYVLESHFSEFIEAFLFENLGASFNVEEVQTGLDGDLFEAELSVAKAGEDLLRVRQCFYEDFKPLYDLLSLYDQYWGTRYSTFSSLKLENPDYRHDYVLSMTVNELHMNAKDRIDMIELMPDIEEEDKIELIRLAEVAPTTLELHNLLKETVWESTFFEEYIQPTMMLNVAKYFKQIDGLLAMCQKEPADQEALKVLASELRRLFMQFTHCFVVLGMEVE